MRKLILPFKLAFLIYLCAHSAIASELDDTLLEDDFLGDIPVVITASRLKQSAIDAPAAISVITRKMIDSSGAREIPELFHMVPGFQVGYSGNESPVVTYQGLTDSAARRLEVMIDGRSIYTPAFGGVPWANLPISMDNIERIEVIRGPNSVSWGSNAFLAIVNIITKDPSTETGVYTSFSAGTERFRKATVKFNDNAGLWNYRGTAEYQYDDGFTGQSLDDEFGTEGQDTKYLHKLMFSANKQLTNNQLLFIDVGISDGKNHTGKTDSDKYNHEKVSNHYQKIKWEYNQSTDDQIYLQLSNNFVRNKKVFQDGHDGDDGYITKRVDLEFQHTKTMDDIRLVWGASTRHDTMKTQYYLSSTENQYNETDRVFSNVEWKPNVDWTFNTGWLYESNTITGKSIVPRLAANYRITPEHSVRTSYTEANRLPVIIESHVNTTIGAYTYIPNYELKNERIKSLEFGYHGFLLDQQLEVDINIFRKKIRDFIRLYAYNDGGAKVQFQNKDRIDYQGAEWQLTYKPNTRTQIIYNHSFVESSSPDTYEQYLPGILVSEATNLSESIPKQTYSLNGIFELEDNHTLGITHYWRDSMYWLEAGGGTKYDLPNIARTDVTLTKYFQGSDKGEGDFLKLAIQNIGGPESDFKKDNRLDTRFHLELGMNFD